MYGLEQGNLSGRKSCGIPQLQVAVHIDRPAWDTHSPGVLTGQDTCTGPESRGQKSVHRQMPDSDQMKVEQRHVVGSDS